MNQIHTEREQLFINLAARLADDFAERAAQHDEDESFPFENYEQMRECGYTNLIIPEEFGGLGASLLERVKAQERLAQGDGANASTGMGMSAMPGMIPMSSEVSFPYGFPQPGDYHIFVQIRRAGKIETGAFVAKVQ